MSDEHLFNDEFLERLHSLVSGCVDEERYSHTICVEEKAVEIAEVYLPNKIGKIKAAAVLHDITKSFSPEEHIAVCRKYGYPIGEDVLIPVLHSVTAPLVIANEITLQYPQLADPEILNAIRWHSTGHADMSLFEAIICLADYIEDSRPYEECQSLRRYFHDGLSEDLHNNYLHLYQTMVIYFGYTIKRLVDEKRIIDLNTVEAWNYFRQLINKPEKGFYYNEIKND